MFAQGTKLTSQINIDSLSIINYIVTPTEEITDMFVQDTNL